MLEIVQIPVMEDNYIYLIHAAEDNLTAVVDPAQPGPVLAELQARGWRLTHIFNTHHHWDHTDGNLELAEKSGCIIVGPRADHERIPGIQVEVGEGDGYQFGGATARVFDVPGHTKGHIAYWFEEDDALFCGDTLFALGCGRMFEGTPQQFWSSLSKLRALPDSTRVFCAHEYTQANARFAVTMEPENRALIDRAAEIDRMRAENRPTVPSTMGAEKATNPFLRADQPAIAAHLGLADAAAADVFAEIRRRKDHF